MGLEGFTKRLVLLFEFADVFARGLFPDAVFVGIAIDQRDVSDQIRLLVGRESGELLPREEVMIVATSSDLEMAIVQNNHTIGVKRLGLLIGKQAQNRFTVGIARRKPSLFDRRCVNS